MFERRRHQAVFTALSRLDADLLARAECYFGGGTAIVLLLGEYRESADVDFLCASQNGYRTLREAIASRGISGLLQEGKEIHCRRDLRADQYGIRTVLEIDDELLKFELVREARIDLDGEYSVRLGVPVLSREDMYAEKLLANADRWADRATLSRDVIDLSVMMSRWGPIPDASWEKAHDAYGTSIDSSYAKAVERIRRPAWLRECMKQMAMGDGLFDEILAQHGGPIEDSEGEERLRP